MAIICSYIHPANKYAITFQADGIFVAAGLSVHLSIPFFKKSLCFIC